MSSYSGYSKYKDSGVAWLGRIPEHWQVRRLKFVARFQSGEMITSESITMRGTFPVYGGNGIRGFTDSYTNEGFSILIGRQGALCGNINYANGKFWASEHAIVVYPFGDHNKKWLGETLHVCNLNRLSQTAAQPGISIGQVRNVQLAPPTLPEQESIARFLDYKVGKIDRFILKKNQLIKLLNEQKAAIINAAVTKGLNTSVPMKDSGIEWLGEIPAHWEVRKLKSLVTKTGSGITPKGGSEVYKSEGIPFLRSQNVHFDGLHLDNVAFIEPEVHESMKGTALRPGDVLLNITGASIGRCCSVPEDFDEGNVNQHVCIIRPKELILSEYLEKVIGSSYIQEKIKLEQVGASREALNQTEIRNLPILTPSLEEQRQILQLLYAETATIVNTVATIQKEIALTEEYRTALIAEAVTGKIDVRGYVVPEEDETEPVLYALDNEDEVFMMAAEDEAEYGK